MIKAIAAMDNNRLIGRGGGLPWPTIKEDFQWFKTFTANQYLVVGSTTYKTLPPLPGRKLLVLTRFIESDHINCVFRKWT